MNERVRSLKQVPLFKELLGRSFDIIAGLVTEETYEEGVEVIHEGEEADRLFILVDGVVRVIKGYRRGNESSLGFEGPISTFGEIGLIDGGPRSASVVTVERCRFFVLEREAFHILLQNNIDICHLLLLEICERLRGADEVAAL